MIKLNYKNDDYVVISESDFFGCKKILLKKLGDI